MKRIFLLGVLLVSCSALDAREPWQVTSRAYGPVKVGMTIPEAELALGTRLHALDDDGKISERALWSECDYVYPSSGAPFSLMVQNDRVTHISVGSEDIHTRSGIHIGDAASKLRQLFKANLEIEPHKYQDNAFYYFVWDADRRHGIKFEIVEDKVVGINAGDQTIMLVEGCS